MVKKFDDQLFNLCDVVYETHRQTDRQTDKQTDSQSDRLHVQRLYAVSTAISAVNGHVCLKFLMIWTWVSVKVWTDDSKLPIS